MKDAAGRLLCKETDSSNTALFLRPAPDSPEYRGLLFKRSSHPNPARSPVDIQAMVNDDPSSNLPSDLDGIYVLAIWRASSKERSVRIGHRPTSGVLWICRECLPAPQIETPLITDACTGRGDHTRGTTTAPPSLPVSRMFVWQCVCKSLYGKYALKPGERRGRFGEATHRG